MGEVGKAGARPVRSWKELVVTVPRDMYGEGRPSRSVDAGRLWTGGVATALVAALVAVVGVLIARGLFDVPVLAPTGEGALGNASTLRRAAFAAIADEKIATSAITLVVGLAIGSLLSGVARSAVRTGR